MATATSSPIKRLRSAHAHHSREEVQKFVVAENEEQITKNQFWEELHYIAEKYGQYNLDGDYHPKDHFKEYMEKISENVHGSRHLPLDRLIKFHNKSATRPLDHPTGTLCRPDFLACPGSGDKIEWSGIDATVEIHSAGTNATEGPRQAAAYTFYLLQARPDRVSVPGFYVDEKGVILIISSAEGAKKSPKLKLSVASDVLLIHAFVQRIYNPHPSMLDPTIKRRKDSAESPWVFDITITNPDPQPPTIECLGYHILHARDSIGQRTHVFINNEHPTRLGNGVLIRVIKDQYRSQKHRFSEDEVIDHIHEEGDIPGVVHVAHSQDVLRSDGSPVCSGDRHKTRICMTEYGEPFMDLETPLEALIAIYDLLETTRLMYKKRKVLHRDISAGNVLHLEGNRTVASSVPADTASTDKSSHEHEFYTINHLLDPSVDPCSTSNLLIDLDRGEILDSKEKEMRLERTGTPIFIARAVRAGKPIKPLRDIIFDRMPELSKVAQKAYERVFPDRLQSFQGADKSYTVMIKDTADQSLWRHQLYHDAESAFWLLVWWAVNASPRDSTDPPTKMPNSLWSILFDIDSDMRVCYLGVEHLDPAYSALLPLLNDLGCSVMHDFHWAAQKPYDDPEFLHEALQRHILNFVFANRDADFMKLPKANAFRYHVQMSNTPSLSNSQVSSRRMHSGTKRQRDLEPGSGTLKKSRSGGG